MIKIFYFLTSYTFLTQFNRRRIIHGKYYFFVQLLKCKLKYPSHLIAGLHAIYNGSLPVNQRVLDVRVRCIECDIPRYEPLELDKYYRIVAQNFIGNGGDGFTVSFNSFYNHYGLNKFMYIP